MHYFSAQVLEHLTMDTATNICQYLQRCEKCHRLSHIHLITFPCYPSFYISFYSILRHFCRTFLFSFILNTNKCLRLPVCRKTSPVIWKDFYVGCIVLLYRLSIAEPHPSSFAIQQAWLLNCKWRRMRH